MQKVSNGQTYRLSVDPQTAKRLKHIALFHHKSEAGILRDLVARQYSYDAEGIKASLDKLADSDAELGEFQAP